MPTITLTDEEAQVVREVLEARHKEMLHEVHHTSHREFRDMLKHRLEVLEAALRAVAGAGGTVQP
jgi:hypothetical protein